MSLVASSSLAICLSFMPVREVIHSSVVSTIFSKSLFVTILRGRYDPKPIMPTFLDSHISLVTLQFFYNVFIHVLCHELGRNLYGVLYRLRRGRAVAYDAPSINPQKRRPAIFG